MTAFPTLDVYIAYDPSGGGSVTLNTAYEQALPSSGSSNSYWTNVAPYVRDFQTKSGKQHFLDRIEAGTLQMTVTNRLGELFNTPAPLSPFLAPRTPIAVTATYSGTTYRLFFGLIDGLVERLGDQLNSDIVVSASDFIKYLSLRYCSVPNFYSTYAKSTNATNWYRCSLDTASTSTLADQIGTSNGTYDRTVATVTSSVTPTFPNYGCLIYDGDTCADMANGTNTAQTFVQLPQTSYSGVDFWILGQGLYDASLSAPSVVLSAGTFLNGLGVSQTFTINTVSNGLSITYAPTAGGASTTVTVSGSIPLINNGYWHHVGWFVNSNTLYIYQDGVTASVTSVSSGSPYISANSPGLALAAKWVPTVGSSGYYLQDAACYLDEIVVSGAAPSYASVSSSELTNRFVAGSLLQRGYPSYTVYSGDRIAELLVLAGFGTISGGTLALTTGIFSINGSAYTTYGSSSNGFIEVQPYYWDNPVTGSTILDLILQVNDTDVGLFFQDGSGKFQWYNQSHYGTWAWNATTNTGTWTTTYSAPTGAQVWSDDHSSSYPYEYAGLQVTYDDADLWSTVKVTPQAGVDQVYENATTESAWGYSTLIKSGTVHPTLNLALSTATYLQYLYRQPLWRVQNVELRNTANNGGNVVAMFTTGLGSVVNFTRVLPGPTAVIGPFNAQVESVAYSFDAATMLWSASYVLDPYPVAS